MNPIDYVILGIIILAVGGIIAYIVVNKKRNKGCACCPYSGKCLGGCQSANNLNDNKDDKNN